MSEYMRLLKKNPKILERYNSLIEVDKFSRELWHKIKSHNKCKHFSFNNKLKGKDDQMRVLRERGSSL